MANIRKNHSGSGAVVMLLIVVIIAIIVGGGWAVYRHNHKAGTTTLTKTTTSSKSTSTQQADPYAGWKTHTNTQYGFSYKYPAIWIPSDDVTTDSTTNATKQEFGTGLKLTTNTKYDDTVNVTVLNESLSAATMWYDNNYAQSSLNKVTKTTTELKGKQSTQYDVTNSGVKSKLYLFAVGSKTYTFGSVNEELNLQTSPNYWTDFQKVFDSLTIQ